MPPNSQSLAVKEFYFTASRICRQFFVKFLAPTFLGKMKDENRRKISPFFRRIFRPDRQKFRQNFALGAFRHRNLCWQAPFSLRQVQTPSSPPSTPTQFVVVFHDERHIFRQRQQVGVDATLSESFWSGVEVRICSLVSSDPGRSLLPRPFPGAFDCGGGGTKKMLGAILGLMIARSMFSDAHKCFTSTWFAANCVVSNLQ